VNRPHFRRHPRPIDPNPEYSRLDRMDGLGTRYDAEWPDVYGAEVDHQYPAQDWLDDLPADQSGFTGMANWPVWDYGEGYEIEPEERVRPIVVSAPRYAEALARIRAALTASPDLPMVRAAATAYDLGLPAPLRSDPPLYRACLSHHVGAGVA